MGAILILLLFALPLLVADPTLTYVINVGSDGNAMIRQIFTARGSGVTYMFLPKTERWVVERAKGSFSWLSHADLPNPFYTNSTLSYRAGKDGRFEIVIRYNFDYSVLMVGRNAWFMSPLIGAPRDVRVVVDVRLPYFKRITAYYPKRPIPLKDGKFEFVIRAEPNGSRVSVNYEMDRRLPDHVFIRAGNGIMVEVRAPRFYGKFANKIMDILIGSAPRLRYLFRDLVSPVEVRFYLPETINLGALGYVIGEDINVGGRGPIHLNLALTRFVKGYLEVTVLHEYVHKLLARAGVRANEFTRWVHEGIADYVSLELAKNLGINTSRFEEGREEMMERLKGESLGFLQVWNPRRPEEEGLYYAGSYYIIRTLASRYGGLEFIRRFVDEVRKAGGVDSTWDVVEALSRAAGEDLKPQFRSWGFITMPERAVPSPLTTVTAALAMGTALVATLAVMRGRLRPSGEGYVQCPYCGSSVPRGMTFCPYCGRELEPPASA